MIKKRLKLPAPSLWADYHVLSEAICYQVVWEKWKDLQFGRVKMKS